MVIIFSIYSQGTLYKTRLKALGTRLRMRNMILTVVGLRSRASMQLLVMKCEKDTKPVIKGLVVRITCSRVCYVSICSSPASWE